MIQHDVKAFIWFLSSFIRSSPLTLLTVHRLQPNFKPLNSTPFFHNSWDFSHAEPSTSKILPSDLQSYEFLMTLQDPTQTYKTLKQLGSFNALLSVYLVCIYINGLYSSYSFVYFWYSVRSSLKAGAISHSSVTSQCMAFIWCSWMFVE